MNAKLTDIKFKIGNDSLSLGEIKSIKIECGTFKIEYCDKSGKYTKFVKMKVLVKDVEVLQAE